MLKCGECTFFCEPDISEGGALGRCSHPEKPKTQITVLLSDPEMIRICDYEAECQHGYPDIWAARGAARLIRMQEKPKKVDHTTTTGVANKQIVNQLGVLVGMGFLAGLAKWEK